MSSLCERACAGLAEAGAKVLSDRSAEGRSGIVTFAVEGHDPAAIVGLLRERRIVCSPRGGGVRLSPHGYNIPEEIDALVAVVSGLVATGR